MSPIRRRWQKELDWQEAESGQAREDLTACGTREESPSQIEDSEEPMNAKLQDPLDWQVEVNRTLSVEAPLRIRKASVLSPEELQEGFKAWGQGMSAYDFGHLIAERDRKAKIDAYIAWCESAPKNQKRATA